MNEYARKISMDANIASDIKKVNDIHARAQEHPNGSNSVHPSGLEENGALPFSDPDVDPLVGNEDVTPDSKRQEELMEEVKAGKDRAKAGPAKSGPPEPAKIGKHTVSVIGTMPENTATLAGKGAALVEDQGAGWAGPLLTLVQGETRPRKVNCAAAGAVVSNAAPIAIPAGATDWATNVTITWSEVDWDGNTVNLQEEVALRWSLPHATSVAPVLVQQLQPRVTEDPLIVLEDQIAKLGISVDPSRGDTLKNLANVIAQVLPGHAYGRSLEQLCSIFLNTGNKTARYDVSLVYAKLLWFDLIESIYQESGAAANMVAPPANACETIDVSAAGTFRTLLEVSNASALVLRDNMDLLDEEIALIWHLLKSTGTIRAFPAGTPRYLIEQVTWPDLGGHVVRLAWSANVPNVPAGPYTNGRIRTLAMKLASIRGEQDDYVIGYQRLMEMCSSVGLENTLTNFGGVGTYTPVLGCLDAQAVQFSAPRWPTWVYTALAPLSRFKLAKDWSVLTQLSTKDLVNCMYVGHALMNLSASLLFKSYNIYSEPMDMLMQTSQGLTYPNPSRWESALLGLQLTRPSAKYGNMSWIYGSCKWIMNEVFGIALHHDAFVGRAWSGHGMYGGPALPGAGANIRPRVMYARTGFDKFVWTHPPSLLLNWVLEGKCPRELGFLGIGCTANFRPDILDGQNPRKGLALIRSACVTDDTVVGLRGMAYEPYYITAANYVNLACMNVEALTTWRSPLSYDPGLAWTRSGAIGALVPAQFAGGSLMVHPSELRTFDWYTGSLIGYEYTIPYAAPPVNITSFISRFRHTTGVTFGIRAMCLRRNGATPVVAEGEVPAPAMDLGDLFP